MGEVFKGMLGLVYLALAVALIWAVLKLFSIDSTLKNILAELKLQKGAGGTSETPH